MNKLIIYLQHVGAYHKKITMYWSRCCNVRDWGHVDKEEDAPNDCVEVHYIRFFFVRFVL